MKTHIDPCVPAPLPHREWCYCKHCERQWFVEFDPKAYTDVFFVCPNQLCGWPHYRHLENGVAVHCDITRRTAEPVRLTS